MSSKFFTKAMRRQLCFTRICQTLDVNLTDGMRSNTAEAADAPSTAREAAKTCANRPMFVVVPQSVVVLVVVREV